jgi:formylglycine-generating enzyme required for sulfatase activity/dienelactone hydrolase
MLLFCGVLVSTVVSHGASSKMLRVPSAVIERVDGATEVPVKVQISEFLIGATEVTQAEFLEIMGYNPSIDRGEQRPVENVNWWEAIRFCNLKSLREGLQPCYDLQSGQCDASCSGYRLPTEAEWEVARGTEEEYPAEQISRFAHLGSKETKSTVDLMARVRKGTAVVGSLAPNRLGLYDMLGNVWEWCHDFNDPDQNVISSFVQPAGPSWGVERVLRGGSYITIQGHWSRAFRSSIAPDYSSRFTGFRLARNSVAQAFSDQGNNESWFQKFNQIPDEFRENLGELSSLTGQEGAGIVATVAAWEIKQATLRQKWEQILGVPRLDPPPSEVRPIRTIHHRYYTGKLMYLRTETDSWEKIFLMMPHQAIRRPLPVVIVPYYDVDTPAGENLGGRSFRPPSVRSFANLLVRQGHIALAVRWFGESYGENYNEAVANLKLRHPGCTGLGKWVWDARRVVDYLCTLPEVDQERIGIIGHSLGAKMTLYAAAMDERIDVAVFSEGGIGLEFSNYEDYWYWGEKIQDLPAGTDHHELLGLIAPRPFLLIGGDDADHDESWFFVNAAREVYEIYGRADRIGFFNHHSGHSPTPESVHLALEWFKHFFQPSP